MAEANAMKKSRGRPRSAGEAQAGTVQALDRGLLLIKALAQVDRSTLTELAMRVGMPASSAHRLLTTMEKHGFASFDEVRQEWMIGIEAFRTGNAFLRQTNLIEASRAVLSALMRESGETANLGIADQCDVVFLSQVETHNPIRAFFRPGTRGPMHASGIGKAILSALPRRQVESLLQKRGLESFTPKTLASPTALFEDLERSATRGWAFDDEERYIGMRCIAAPIFNSFGEAAAGISVSGPTVRFPDDAIDEIAVMVKRAAGAVTKVIAGQRPSQTGAA